MENFFKFFFSSIFPTIFNYIVDIRRFILQPREYFNILSRETAIQITRRFIIYAVGFNILVISLMGVTNAYAIGIFKIPPKLFGVIILDFIWGLFTIPPLVLTGKFCKNKVGLKQSFIYCLTFRFCYLLVPVIFYSLFLLTENYLFALVRGISFYLYLICFFLFFPYWFSVGLKNKILTIFLSFTSGLLTIALFAYLLISFPNDLQIIKKGMVIYDPIGSEANAVISQTYKYGNFNFHEFRALYKLLKDSISKAEKMPNGRVVVSLKEVKKLELQWNTQKVSSKKQLEDQLLQISNYSNSSKYLTTKKFLRLKEEEIKSALNTIIYLDNCFNELHSDILKFGRFQDIYIEFLDKAKEYQDKQMEFLSTTNEFRDVLYKFINLGLIVI